MTTIRLSPAPRAAAVWLALLLGLAAILACAPARAQQVIRTVDWTLIPVGGMPTADAHWTTFDLPHRWTASETALQGVAMRMRFRVDTIPKQAWAVLITHASDGGQVQLNGRFLGALRAPDAVTHVRWRRPHLLAIDPSLLLLGENVLTINTAYRGGSHLLAGVEVGTLAEMSEKHERHFFLAYTVPWIGLTLAAVVTLLFGVLWIRRPEPLLGLLTLAAALWMLRSSFFLIEAVPLGMRSWLRLLYYLSSGGFAAVMTLTLLRQAGRREKRDTWLALGYAAIGPVIFALTAQQAAPLIDSVWLPGLVLMAGIAFIYAIWCRLQRRESPPGILLWATAIAIGAATHDFLMSSGFIEYGSMFALHWAGPLLLIALATPLVDRFVRILREAEAARAELETRVREREQLLKRNFERLRESERLQATAQERARIMQDMHDGLGSQLLSSLMLVERGAVEQPQVAQILRECIDDMRLAIDAMASEDAGLLSALGNLRFRMEPRLRAAGIELNWDARGLPEEIDIDPDAVLPILRIVQEALTNALKHSRARAVRVVLAVEGPPDAQFLTIRVTDNGRGITEERVGGRGLINMRNRAQRIGAQLKLETVPGAGTMVQLAYKLEPELAGATTRLSQLSLNTEAVIERAKRI